MVPLMSVITTFTSYLIFPHSKAVWMFLVPALDPSNWSLFWLPFHLIRESLNKTTTDQSGASDRDEPSN